MKGFNLEAFLHQGSIISTRPGYVLVGWGDATRSATLPAQGAFFIADFFLKQKKPWLCYAQQTEMQTAHLLELLGPQVPETPLSWQSPFKQVFFEALNELQTFFATQKLVKAVPYVFEVAEQSMSFSRLRHTLQNALGTAYGMIYGSWGDRQGFIGVTPELLFELHGKTLKSQALAGTGSKTSVQTPKNHVEHQIVIDGIRQALSPFGNVIIGKTVQLDLPHLSHLLTPIEVITQIPPPYHSLVKALHPTPALGAFPYPFGNKWLLEYNRILPRFYYGAPVGYQLQESAAAYVAIRNVQWTEDALLLGAGCGIILTSIPENEWAEIEMKINSIKRVLGL